jgi:hypothetical protein
MTLAISIKCYYAECYYAECRYVECRYADCRGALISAFKSLIGQARELKHSSLFCQAVIYKEKRCITLTPCNIDVLMKIL